MKRTLKVGVYAAGLMLGACGGQAPAGTDVESGASQQVTMVATEGQAIEVRMLGVDASDYEAVRLSVRSLRVTAGEMVLPVEAVVSEADLGRPDHAPLVGRFLLPEGVEAVDVAVEFGDTGELTRAGAPETVDLRAPPIRFTSHADWLALNHHAVVHLSVARSLVRTGDSLLLLPNLSVHH